MAGPGDYHGLNTGLARAGLARGRQAAMAQGFLADCETAGATNPGQAAVQAAHSAAKGRIAGTDTKEPEPSQSIVPGSQTL